MVERPAALCVAAYVGQTRLIDNVLLTPPPKALSDRDLEVVSYAVGRQVRPARKARDRHDGGIGHRSPRLGAQHPPDRWRNGDGNVAGLVRRAWPLGGTDHRRDRQRFAPAVVPDEVLPALELDPGETIHYRQVRLMRGSLPLAAAENWFVPQRLTAAMNEALIRTNVPFGRVIAPLQPVASHARGEHPQPHAEIILVHSAVILSKAGTALALVKESYFSDLVAFASAPSPLHQPVNESFEPSEAQNVGLAP